MQPVGVDAFARFFFRLAGRISRREFALGVGPILTALSIPLVVAQLVAGRCHDIGLPGSHLLLLFVPILVLAWLMALLIIPGNPNAYGPPPRFAARPGGDLTG